MLVRFRAAAGRASRALRHRNYRLLFIGQGISLTGTWMQQLALSWLVYRLTGSALLLGVVAFAGRFPAFLVAPLAGVLADRWDRHRIVVATQTGAMLQATVLTVVVITGVVQVWHLIVLATVLGFATGMDIPARQSLFVDLVAGDRDALASAIALNSSLFNATRLVGPALGGVLLAAFGEGPVFAVNAASYVAVLWALLAMDLSLAPSTDGSGAVVQQLREGFRYAFRFSPIRALLTMMAAASLLGMPYVVLLPVFAADVLAGGPTTLGFLMSAAGLGALTGALYLAARRTVRGLSLVIVVAGIVFGASLVAFSGSRMLWLSALLLLPVGAGMMVLSASVNTILQTIVPTEMRGRIMSLYMMAFMGMSTIGSLSAGTIADVLGAPITVALGGLGCLVMIGWFARQRPGLRALVRPIYRELGLIPEVASGLQSATELRGR